MAVDLRPATLDLYVYSGDSLSVTVNFVDSAGEPVDVSAQTWTAKYRTTRDAVTAISFTINSAGAATGTLILTLTTAETASLANGRDWRRWWRRWG